MLTSVENYSDNYIGLAQLSASLDANLPPYIKKRAVERILIGINDINYSIPENAYFKSVQPDWIGYTALHLTVEKNQLDICKILIQHGANFTIKNGSNETPLHQAIKYSKNNKVECWKLIGKLDHPFADLVLSAHIDSNIPLTPCNTFGLSHFHIACMTNHAKAVEFFLKNGTSVNDSIPHSSPILPGFTPLHLAARYCALEVIKMLLNHGADVHVKDSFDMSPMHILIQRNMQIVDWHNMESHYSYEVFETEFETNKKIIKLLLEKHKIYSTNTVDKIGLSWLHVACVLQDFSMLELAIDRSGIQNTAINNDSPVSPGYTALHFASHFSLDAVKFLLTKGADVMAKDAKGITPLDLCLQRYEPEDIHCILQSHSTMKNIQLSDGKTNLVDLVLAMKSCKGLKSFLTNSVPNLNVFVPLDSKLWPGYTPLHLAVVLKHYDCINNEEKLFKNTDHVRNDCIKKPRICTKEEDLLKYMKRIKLCVALGADVTVKDANGSTPIHLAFYLKNEDVVKLLLKNHKEIVNPSDSNGLSHLHIACAVSHENLVKKFLKTGCDVNSRVNSRYDFNVTLLNADDMQEVYKFSISPGSTALHIAVSRALQNMSEILMKHGADVYAQDALGLTPIHLTAISRYHLCLIGVNKEGTVDLLPSVKNLKECVSNIGFTHLHVACKMGDIKAVKKLILSGAKVDATIGYSELDESSIWYSFRKAYAGSQPIQFAAQTLNTEIIAFLISLGADILYKRVDLSTPFYGVLFAYNTFDERNIFYSMIKDSRDLQMRIESDTGLTMLHFACAKLETDYVGELLRRGANANAQAHVDSPFWPGWTPLHIVIYKSYYELSYLHPIIELLLDHGADVTLKNAEQNTPLHAAFMSPNFLDDYPDVILPMYCHTDFSVNPVNAHGISHFHLACFSNDANAVQSFLNHLEEIPYQQIDYFSEHYGGYSPLHLAAVLKNEDLIGILLDHDFDVDARTDCGWTVLHDAADGGWGTGASKELLENLIKESNDPNAQSFYGETALELLLKSSYDSKQAVKAFLKRSSHVNIFNDVTGDGYIGIMVGTEVDGLKGIKRHPFYKGVISDPERNRVDHMGRTPIHNIVSCTYAIVLTEHCAELIANFIKVGCDINHQDNKGRTALHSACQFRHSYGIVGLLMNGIDMNLLDFDGNSAFTYCLHLRRSEYSHDYILRNVATHLHKLQYFGIYVSQINEEIGRQIPVSTAKKTLIEKRCQEEYIKLQDTKFEPYSICLADFLSETGLIASYPKLPMSLHEILDAYFVRHRKHLLEDYPNLVGLLLMQYAKALTREAFIEPAHKSLNSLVGFPVPHVCVDIIFGFLANNDLKSLIASSE